MTRTAELPSDYPPPGMEVRLIQRFVNIKGRRVLEIGCGDGRLTRQYAPLASSVVAVEPDLAKIRVARRAAAADGVTNVSFRVGAAERLPPRGGPFDIALFSWSLWWIAVQGMVHALERARKYLVPGGALVCVQPRRIKRPLIAVTAPRQRWPVASLINPVFEPLIWAAEAAIETVVTERLFVLIGRKNHQFRVRLANPNQLDRYLHLGQRPPRFPGGGRSRLRALWKSRRPGTQIEVTEFMATIVLRAVDKARGWQHLMLRTLGFHIPCSAVFTSCLSDQIEIAQFALSRDIREAVKQAVNLQKTWQGIPGSQQRLCSVMGESPPTPIACTLTAADLRDRQGAWAKLLSSGLVDRDRVAGGIRLHAARGAAAALIELIDLERECCPWIQFAVTRDPIAGEADVFLTAEGEGEAVLAGMFVAG